MPSKEELLEEKTVDELKQMARDKKISRYSNKTKSELIELIRENYQKKEIENWKPPPTHIPGKFEERVFIGGNYDQMDRLRKIREMVDEMKDFTTILPYDDFNLPDEEIHDWDLRLLHQCRYAIFDIGVDGGQFFEIGRCKDYNTRTLLVTNHRDPLAPISEASGTMVRQSGHPIEIYGDYDSLKPKLKKFLKGESYEPFEMAKKMLGYEIGYTEAKVEIMKNGKCKHRYTYENVKALENRTISKIYHRFNFGGDIIDAEFSSSNSGVCWNPVKESESEREGAVEIEGGLDEAKGGIDYSMAFKTKGTYSLTKDQLPVESDKPLLSEGYEYIQRTIYHPLHELYIKIDSFPEYLNMARPSVRIGGEEDAKSMISRQSKKFMSSDDKAKLKVFRPKPFHKYVIVWKPPAS